MIAGSLEILLTAPMAQLARDMAAAKQVSATTMADVARSVGMTEAQLRMMIEVSQQQQSIFKKTWEEAQRLWAITKQGAQDAAQAIAKVKLDPNAMVVPSEAMKSLRSWQEQLAFSVGTGAAIAADKARTVWDETKGFVERQVTIWGIALAVGVSAAVISAVYAAYKAVSFGVGLITGESYKSENVDALIALNAEVKKLQAELPLTAVGASALNEALKAGGVSVDTYSGVLQKAGAAVRTNRDELDRLGVAYKDQNGNLLTTEETLKSAAAVLATYKEGWDRQQAAAAIGMGSEKEIQAALQITAQKVADAKARLVEYHLIIGPGTQAAITQYQTGMRAFQRESELTSQGFKAAIARNVMPLLTDLASFFQDGFPTAVKAFDVSLAVVTTGFYSIKTAVFGVSEIILGAFGSITSLLGGLGIAAARVLSGDFSGAKDIMVAAWTDAQKRLREIGTNIEAQAKHNAAAVKLAWASDSRTAMVTPNATTPTGKSWVAKQAEDAAEANTEYDRLIKTIAEKTAVMQGELAGTAKLTDAEQLALKAMVELRDGTVTATEAERIALRQKLETLLAVDRELRSRAEIQAAAKAEIELYDKQATARAAFAESVNATRRAFDQQADAMALETRYTQAEIEIQRSYGQNQVELTRRLTELNIAKQTELGIDRLRREEREKLNKIDADTISKPEYARQVAAIYAETQRQIEALPDQLRASLGAKGVLAEVEKFNGEAVRIGNSLNDSITDGLMRGFEAGKDFTSDFVSTLKNTFKSLILRPIIQFAMQPLTGAVSSVLAGLTMSGGAAASTGGGAGGISLGSLGDIGSLLSKMGGSFPGANIGLSLAGGIQNLGLSTGSTAITEFGNTLNTFFGEGIGAGVGSVAPYIGSIIQLAQGNVKGAAISGALTAIGSAFGPIGAAVGAVVGSLIGGGKSKAPAVGTGYTFSGDFTPGQGVSGLQALGNYTAGDRSGYDVMDPSKHVALFEAAIQPAYDQFAKLARVLGLDASAIGTTSFRLTTNGIGQAQDDASKPAAAGILLNKWAEQLLPNVKDLQQEGEEVIQTFTRLATELQLTDKIAEIMGKDATAAFGAAGAASIEMRDKLVQAMGGLADATSLTQSYYENFYSDAERHAADLALVNKAIADLGLTTLPETRAQFRALVEAQDLTTAAGRDMFAGLLKLAPAFASVTEAATDAAQAQIDALNDVVSSWAGVAKTLREYSASLFGNNIPGGTSYASALRAFNATSLSARMGDVDAAAKLKDVSETFREASLRSSGQASDYIRDLARIRAAVDGTITTADQQVTIAQQQLAELRNITGLLGGIPGHASGGVATGWSFVGESGPELVDFGTPGRVYTAQQTAGMFAGSADTSAMEARLDRIGDELAAMRMEVRSGLLTVARHTGNSFRVLDRVTKGGTSLMVSQDDDDEPLRVIVEP